jgi:hypothetical protein
MTGLVRGDHGSEILGSSQNFRGTVLRAPLHSAQLALAVPDLASPAESSRLTALSHGDPRPSDEEQVTLASCCSTSAPQLTSGLPLGARLRLASDGDGNIFRPATVARPSGQVRARLFQVACVARNSWLPQAFHFLESVHA